MSVLCTGHSYIAYMSLPNIENIEMGNELILHKLLLSEILLIFCDKRDSYITYHIRLQMVHCWT